MKSDRKGSSIGSERISVRKHSRGSGERDLIELETEVEEEEEEEVVAAVLVLESN